MQNMQTKDMETVYNTLIQLKKRGEIKKAKQIIKNIPPKILAAPGFISYNSYNYRYNMLGISLLRENFEIANLIMLEACKNIDILLDKYNSVLGIIARRIYYSHNQNLEKYKFILDKMISILKPDHKIWNTLIKYDDCVEGTIIVALIKQNLLPTAKLLLSKEITLTFKVKSKDIFYYYQYHPVVQAICKFNYSVAKEILSKPSCVSDNNSFLHILNHLIPHLEKTRLDSELLEILQIIIHNCPNLRDKIYYPCNFNYPTMNLLTYSLIHHHPDLTILLLQSKKFSASQLINFEGKNYSVLMFRLLHYQNFQNVIHHLISGEYYYHADYINHTGETALIIGAKCLPPKQEYDDILLKIAQNTLVNWDLAQVKNKNATTAINIILKRNHDILPSKHWWSFKKKNYLLLEEKEIIIFPQTVKYLREMESTQTIELLDSLYMYY